MANALNPQQAKFAGLVATGLTAAEAYRQAGYHAKGQSLHVCASKMLRTAKVAQEVLRLRTALSPVRKEIVVTQASVTAMLADAYADARVLGQPAAAVQASLGIAKLHGLLVDKYEDVTRRPGRSPDVPVEIEVEHWVNDIVKALPQPEPLAKDQSPDTAIADDDRQSP